MIKKYSNVASMLSDSQLDDSVRAEVEKTIAERTIVKNLTALRVSRDMSQGDIANHMGCSQSRISKMENGVDADMRLGDVCDYLSAIGMDLSVVVAEKDLPMFPQIKFHAFMIRRCLEQLVEFAGDDDAIQHGVSKAHIETLFNIVRLIVDCAKGLPNFPQMLPGFIEVEEMDEACESCGNLPGSNNREAAPA